MRLLLVHGRAQQGKSPQIVEQEWMAALRRGLANVGLREPADLKISAPFYGDDLVAFVNRTKLPPADNVATRGEAGDGYAMFLEQVASQLNEDGKVTAAELDSLLDPTQPRAPQNWAWVRAIIRVVDSRVPTASSYSIGKVLRDVYIYVNNRPVRRAINRIVAAELTDEPTVVLAHSLGSVVAYEVLREHAGNTVPRLVTVGSPLGIRAIRNRLATPLAMPAGVGDWLNAFDKRDVVSLYPLDNDNFGILVPAIRNFGSVDNHTGDRHGIDGYLDNPDVAREVHAALSGTTRPP